MREGQKRDFARQLRSAMTDAERRLWQQLRRHQLADFRFRRQHPIGPYIADFVCLSARLVIEIDGGQHNEPAADMARDASLQARGFEVLHFWNNDVLSNTEGVCDVILRHLIDTYPHANLPPHAEEGAKGRGNP